MTEPDAEPEAGPPEVHVLRDGTKVMVRPLEASDRDALARGFAQLSPSSRRLRFFSPVDALTPAQLDYLTDVDHERHDAIGAILIDDAGAPGEGVGVGRWIRLDDDPRKAEIAVTVLDEYQGRGIGTLLIGTLAQRAIDRGVETFVAQVLWENIGWLESLRSIGARVEPDEAGVARIEFDLNLPPATQETVLRRVLREVATWLAELRAKAEAERT
ncbi:MAG: GNAT family N-acetyltransferase [Acidimicrobiales bacterium]